MSPFRRTLADIACLLLCLAGWLLLIPLVLWRGVREGAIRHPAAGPVKYLLVKVST